LRIYNISKLAVRTSDISALIEEEVAALAIVGGMVVEEEKEEEVEGEDQTNVSTECA
jgi:ATP phosphoribosyltransferase